MAPVTRLVTLVELREDDPGARRMSISARHEAVLADGRRLLLLDDRGWTSSLRGGGPGHEDAPDMWALTSVEEIEGTARMVVGPDEPFDGRSQDEMEAAHWDYLSAILEKQGVNVDAEQLRRLPHEVVLGERLRARLAR